MLTVQDAFDKVWNWFIIQQKPMQNAGPSGCMYRSPEGICCAAGIFISDDDYKPRMEGQSFETIAKHYSLGIPDLVAAFLTKIQRRHDLTFGARSKFEDILEIMSREYDLEIREMTERTAFRRVYQWFVIDKHPQSVGEDVCVYRGKNDAKCAAGVLIPDSMYNTRFDGNDCGPGLLIDDLVKVSPECKKLFEPCLEAVTQLQAIHDSYDSRFETFFAYMRRNLRQFAVTHNLIDVVHQLDYTYIQENV